MEKLLQNRILDRLEYTYRHGQSFHFFQKDYYAKIFNKIISTEDLELLYNTYGNLYYGSQSYTSMIENGESRPFWQYYILGKPCSSLLCDKLKEKIIPFNYPFWDIFYPPNHPGCNASIRALTKKEVAEGGLQRLETVKIIHPFPEWAFNPAKFDWRDFFYNFIVETINKRRIK